MIDTISLPSTRHKGIEKETKMISCIKDNVIISEEEKSNLERILDSNIPKGIIDIIDQIPEDVKQLTIRNLDTGEEFIIGETDPDFDFDTFELGTRRESTGTSAGRNQRLESAETSGSAKSPIMSNSNEKATLDTTIDTASERESNKNKDKDTSTDVSKTKPVKTGILARLYKYLFTSSSSNISASKSKSTVGATDSNHSTKDALGANKPFKTPFTKLSSFKFRRELGKGAFGRVLLAQAKVDGQLYALKIISKKDMRTSDKRQAKAERDILHAMGHTAPHPFTAGLRFAFQSVNHLYLGMDYFPGGNLRELIKKYGSLPEDWVRFYATELVLAIAHMHSLNVLYRDIKPHNVMLDACGHIILIDFGLSKQEISHPRGAMSLVGTPDYSAPEVLKTGVYQIEQHNKQKVETAAMKRDKNKAALKGRKDNRTKSSDETMTSPKPMHIGYGKAADWWSVGVMIYEMLSGVPAFRGADLRETYQKVLFGDLEFKPADKFSTSARQLISGLLRRDPSLRLGAWASPPTDLMSQTFFSGVNWEAALRKDSDGPWVPAPVDYPMVLSSRSTSVDNVLSPTSPVTELGVPVASPTRDDNMINTKDSIPTNAPIQSTLTTGILTTEAHVKQTQLLTADMSAVRAAAVLRSGGVFAKPSTSSGQGAQVPMISSETSKQQPQYSFRSPMMKIGSGHRAAVVTPATVDTCLSDAVSPVLSPTENQENLPVNLLGSTTTNTALATQKPAVVQKFTHVETKEEIRRLSLDFRASDGTKNRSTVAPVEEEELIPNRDSIFISGSTSHAVAGWSFVDVRAIRMALANGHVR